MINKDHPFFFIKSILDDESTYSLSKYIYLPDSLSDERMYFHPNGTELNEILPKMSPLNPQYLTKKQSVFQKIAAFVEKFKGVGGKL